MGDTALVRDIQALARLLWSIERFAGDAASCLAVCEREAARAAADAEERVSSCAHQVEGCQDRLDEARRALACCEGDEDADCSVWQNEVDVAVRELAAARERLDDARRARGRLEAAVAEYRAQAVRTRQIAVERPGQARAFLLHAIRTLLDYTGETTAGTDLGGGQAIGDPEQMHAIVSILRDIPELKPEKWETLDVGRRLEVLRMIEERAAAIQGRSPLPVSLTDLSQGCYGICYGDRIELSASVIAGPSSRHLICTILHEGRHAYQNWAVRHPGFHPDAAQVEEWRRNQEDYISPDEDFEGYYRQPLEVDARRYSESIVDLLDNGGMQ